MKVCRKCGETKPLDLFSRDRSRPDGRRNACKACDAIHDAKPEHKARRSAYNRSEAGKAAFRKYRRTEQGRGRSKVRYIRVKNDPKYKRRNVSYVLKYMKTQNGAARVRAYAQLPRMLAYRKRWRVDNRTRVRASLRAAQHRRAARKRMLPATLTPTEWSYALRYFGYRCAYCCETRRLLQEHFVPLSADGPYTAANIVPACWSCNNRKRDKMPQQWCEPERLAAILAYFDQLNVRRS